MLISYPQSAASSPSTRTLKCTCALVSDRALLNPSSNFHRPTSGSRGLDLVAEKKELESQVSGLKSQLAESKAVQTESASEVLRLKERLESAEKQAAKDQELEKAHVIKEVEAAALWIGGGEAEWTDQSQEIQRMGDILIEQLDSEDPAKWINLCAVGETVSNALEGVPFVGPAFRFAGVFFGQLKDLYENCRELIYLSLEILLMLELFSEIGKNQGFKDAYWKKSAGRLHLQMLMRALKNADAATNAIKEQIVATRAAMAGANKRRIEEASEKLHTARRNFCEALITNTVLNIEATMAVVATSAKHEGTADDIILKGKKDSREYKSPLTEPVGGHLAKYDYENYLSGDAQCMAVDGTWKHRCKKPADKVYRVTGKVINDKKKIDPALILCVCNDHSMVGRGFLNQMSSVAELVYPKEEHD
eukprot:gene18510-25011_t